jgi:hypothetical protein
VLVVFPASPPYTAVRLWPPTASADVDSVAVPDVTLPVPRLVVPSKKVIPPLAVAGVTVAVSVTDPPKVDGFADEPSAVALIVCTT